MKVRNSVATVSFSLVVIRAADVQASLTFYGALGLSFVKEQHGSGPVHYFCELGGMVVEIYPGQPGNAPEARNGGATMIGFNVPDLNDVLMKLKTMGIEPESPPKDADWGLWVNVNDPDGRVVQLVESLS
jgi:catechol 2,3-dioxygenase-like lactoylglutathione lyase family enzyme